MEYEHEPLALVASSIDDINWWHQSMPLYEKRMAKPTKLPVISTASTWRRELPCKERSNSSFCRSNQFVEYNRISTQDNGISPAPRTGDVTVTWKTLVERKRSTKKVLWYVKLFESVLLFTLQTMLLLLTSDLWHYKTVNLRQLTWFSLLLVLVSLHPKFPVKVGLTFS